METIYVILCYGYGKNFKLMRVVSLFYGRRKIIWCIIQKSDTVDIANKGMPVILVYVGMGLCECLMKEIKSHFLDWFVIHLTVHQG